LVPGHKESYLLITQKGEDKKFVPLLKAQDEVAVEEVEGAEEVVADAAEQTVVEEQPEVQVSEEVKEAVEESATPEPVESVEETASTENVDESKEEEDAK
jgi:hypothetical protein